MKKRPSKSQNLKRFVSAVRKVVAEEVGKLNCESVACAYDPGEDLLWDIKEMLQNALVGAYLAPAKELISGVFHDRFRLTDDKRAALEDLNTLWANAHGLRSLLASAPPIIRELFIATLREDVTADRLFSTSGEGDAQNS